LFPRSILSAFDTPSRPPTFGAAKFWSPAVGARNEPTRRGSRDLLLVGHLSGFPLIDVANSRQAPGSLKMTMGSSMSLRTTLRKQ